MYLVFRLVFRLLTGIAIRVGNFSALSSSAYRGLSLAPMLGTIMRPQCSGPAIEFFDLSPPRGRRHFGESHMRYSRLVAHGLSAVAVFREVVAARLILFYSGALAALSALFGMELFARQFTTHVIPVGAVITTGVLILFTLRGSCPYSYSR